MKIKWKLFDYVNAFLMLLIALICIYPLIYVVSGAFNEGVDYMRGGIYLFPRKFSLDNFKMVFSDKRLLIGFRVTIARTIIGTIAGTLFTALVSYGMSRKDLPCRNLIYWFNIFTMFFGGGLIPTYLVFNGLGLINHFSVYIIPSLYSVFNMIVFSNFFKEIPEEIHESGAIDGANEFQIFFRLYLPLSGPVLATIALWVGIAHWNSFFDSMVYTSDANLQTLQLFLVKLIKEAAMAQGEAATRVPAQVVRTTSITTIRYAAIVVSSLLIFIVYPFVQKYLSKGVILGAVKG
ncbi:carbohydrate ABC transporter permease [Eisenbergiella sp.]|uniref:carbohydrate ABC transporter permease n=1 Tax=Eisenbergiella sp. TaxID=1924109 RepID=UPI002A8231B6|nr:carbohydrate ABC transporter permease [Eisenbergiella sp.]